MRRGVSTQDALWEMLSTDHLELLPRDASDGLRMRELMAGRGTPAMKFTVILAPEMDGGYSVICPAVPGCVSQGHDLATALVNVQAHPAPVTVAPRGSGLLI